MEDVMTTKLVLTVAMRAEINAMIKGGETLTYSTEYVIPQLKGCLWKYSEYMEQIVAECDITPLDPDGLVRVAWVEVLNCMRVGKMESDMATIEIMRGGMIKVMSAKKHVVWHGEESFSPDWSVIFPNPISGNDPIVTIRRF
jgi:hypothetical protein